MKNRVNDYHTISLKAKRILRRNNASLYCRGLYSELVELEHRLLKDCTPEITSFFFSYLPRPGNPPPRTKGHVYSLCVWTGGDEKSLREGVRFLEKIGLIETGDHRRVNPYTGKKSRARNVDVRIIH